MSVRPPLFQSATSLRPLLVDGSAISGEVDLRTEFDQLIYGPDGDGLRRHGHPVILRRVRRNADGYPTYCECAAEAPSRQGNTDCQYCAGEGFLWDEEWIMTYSMYVGPDGGQANRYVRMPSGSVKVDYRLFFFRYDSDVRYDDKIVEPRLDEEGNVTLSSTTNSYIRLNIYKPQTINAYRSDQGRIEYFGVYCREEDAIRNDNAQ